jgi:diguanylate cyclase (GGDEF)-like protein/PAS domain S-box-containing protein
MNSEHQLAAQLAAMRQLHRVVGELNTTRDLGALLRVVTDSVVGNLGFEIAAVVVVRPDRHLEVAAVAGPTHATSLIGQIGDRATWDAMLANGDVWGPLRFVKYQIWPDDIPGGTQEVPACEEDEPWQPMDGLLVPLRTPEGDLVGVLSVDKPVDGRQPTPWQDDLLHVFAAQAAIAIDNARLHVETVAAVERLETERRALRASEESFRQTFDGAPTGMALISLRGSRRGRFVRVNVALCSLLGYDMTELYGRSLCDLVEAEDCGWLEEIGDSTELRLRRGDGGFLWVAIRASVITGADREDQVRLLHVEDVDERMRRERHLAHLASHDPLTGLPNRSELHERLDQALAEGQAVALMFCDLNDFKTINDRYGHGAGDTVLVEVARRLAAGVRSGDLVARLGGDEFVVLARNLGEAEAHRLADRLSGSLRTAVALGDDRVVHPSGSFGIAWAPTGTKASTAELLECADREMYREKRARRSAGTSSR